MRNWILSVLTLATLGLSAQAQAAPFNGVLSGLAVVWTASDHIAVEPGEGYVVGNRYLGNVASFLFTANLQGGGATRANTPYYVYACWDTTVMPNAFSAVPVLSAIAPTNDGIGAGIKTSAGDACDAVFLGSVVTDSTNNLVPFVRTGEEVTLSLVRNVAQSPGGGCPAGNWFFGAGAVNVNLPNFSGGPCWEVTFNSKAGVGNSCNGVDDGGNELFLPYPATASAMLIDWILENGDIGTAHSSTVPYETPNPAGPVTLSNYQLNLYTPAAWLADAGGTPFTFSYPRYYSHTRVNPTVAAPVNVGLNPPAPPTQQDFYVCIDNVVNPAQTSVGGYAIYRGYVESIGHLTQE